MILLISKQIWNRECRRRNPPYLLLPLQAPFGSLILIAPGTFRIPIPMAYGHVRRTGNNNECKLPQWTI